MSTSTQDIKTLAAQYPLRVRWSEEDDAFVGTIEGLAGDCCHGDDAREVFETLQRLAEETVEECLRIGKTLPSPFSVRGAATVEAGAVLEDPDPVAIRAGIGLSQSEFARVLA